MNKPSKVTSRSLLVISTILSLALVLILAKDLSLADLSQAITGASTPLILLFIASSLMTSLFRTILYRLLCKAQGYPISPHLLFLVVLARNALSDLLPARIGSAIYIYLLNSRLKVPLDVATSSFAIPFIFDWVALAPMIIIASMMLGGSDPLSVDFLAIGGALFFISLGLALKLDSIFRLVARLITSLSICKALSQRVACYLTQTAARLSALKGVRIYWQALLLSVFIRGGKYVTLYILLLAILSPMGFSLEQLPFHKIFLGICAAETSATLPISGLGGFGIYQGTWSLTFQLLGYPQNIATLTSFAHHLITQFWGYSIGICALIVLAVSNRRGA